MLRAAPGRLAHACQKEGRSQTAAESRGKRWRRGASEQGPFGCHQHASAGFCNKTSRFWPRNRVLARNCVFSSSQSTLHVTKAQVGYFDNGSERLGSCQSAVSWPKMTDFAARTQNRRNRRSPIDIPRRASARGRPGKQTRTERVAQAQRPRTNKPKKQSDDITCGKARLGRSSERGTAARAARRGRDYAAA